MRRVLLTGAGGYVGRSTIDELIARDFEVHAVSRRVRQTCGNTERLIWHEADLLDTAATGTLLARIAATHLVHLAWITEPGIYRQSPENAQWQRAGVELLNGFAEHGGTRAVLAGTCAEYDWTDGYCSEETTPLRAQSAYASAKLAFREAARSTDLSIAWARVFFSFGPYEHPRRLVPSVVAALLAGRRAACSDGEQLRDFIYVRDLASAIAAVLDSEFRGDINTASGTALTIKELVLEIAGRLGAEDRVDFGALARQDGEPPRISADVSRLRDSVGWTPRYSLGAALDETIAWWRQQDA